MTQRSGFEWPALAGLACSLLLAATVRPAAAQVVPDTLDHFDAASTVPLIANDPFDGTPHVGYQNSTAFVHVDLTVIDVAGRRVASTEDRLDAGASSLSWTPDGLRAGVYRVIARADGARIGSAPVVVLR